MTLDLGFAEKCEPWRLESRFFPSKIGGRPAWLDLKDIPCGRDLECEYCSDPCVFLCQVYAPYEEDIDAFHRTIYIFICKNVECCRPNQNGNLKVFRSQLRRINIFYPTEPPLEEKDRRKDVSLWTKTCYVCGILAHSHCAKCKAVDYCSRTHQVYDWKNGHKDTCGIRENSSNNFLFPEYEIATEKDNVVKEDSEQDDFESEQKEIEEYNAIVQEAGALQHEDDDLLRMASDEKDETFAQFRTKMDNYPDQILRYDRGGKILYISSRTRIINVPKCPRCNGDRQFEFQNIIKGCARKYSGIFACCVFIVIFCWFPCYNPNKENAPTQVMPQLLNFLDLKDVKSLDWGILAVFTCKQSCVPSGKYVREYIWKQDITQDTTESEIGCDT